MGDGATCHYCRRSRCVCGPSTATESRARVDVDLDKIRQMATAWADPSSSINRKGGGRLCDATSTVFALLDQVKQLRDWIDRLQAGKVVTCVYCGHEYGPDPGTPTSKADQLKAHIEACPDHPMSALRAKLAIAVEALVPTAAGCDDCDKVQTRARDALAKISR